jgi:uncharacterized protein (TIGR03437 family)
LVGSQLRQLQVAGASLFAVSVPGTDVFVAKLDPDGNILYSTYFGGSGVDTAVSMAVGNDGSVYVAGQTNSTDFPVTGGVYATTFPAALSSSFVFKLNPDGSVAWSTYFPSGNSSVSAIAVDAAGNPYISGSTFGGLPTTPGAYQTQFTLPNTCGGIGPCFPPTEGFLAKFNAKGSALVFSTYLSNAGNGLTGASTGLALDPAGNAYMAGGGGIFLMNAAGSNVLKSTMQRFAINAIVLDASGNLYATGSTNVPAGAFPATPGAFQALPTPAYPALPGQSAGAGGDAFVVKFDSSLSQILAATLIGGEGYDVGKSIAVDSSSGSIIVCGETDSQAFPARAPFQGSFAPRSGFVAAFDATLSQLLFSTYLGSTPFSGRGAIPDGRGNILLAGSTLASRSGFTTADTVIANKIVLQPAPTIRLDSVVNFASQIGLGLSPGEAIVAMGDGFGPDAQLLVDGTPLQVVSASQNRIVAIVPADAPTSGARQMKVSSGGASSNAMFMPSVPVSPGIYSADGTGFGQGYILNADRTLNSPSNPATAGDPITIFATGVGQFTTVNGYAVTALPVAVFVDGFYANGIAAVMKQEPGQPGNVYEIGVYIPDPASLVAQNPDLKGFKFPPLVSVSMILGGVRSQFGIALSLK